VALAVPHDKFLRHRAQLKLHRVAGRPQAASNGIRLLRNRAVRMATAWVLTPAEAELVRYGIRFPIVVLPQD
jgi:hypothetical protein